FSTRRRHTRSKRDWSSDVCSSDLEKQSAKAYKVDPNHPLIKIAADCYEKAFQKETVFVRMGGSIPVVEWFDALYQKPVILMGFGTPEDRLHSPNESFP